MVFQIHVASGAVVGVCVVLFAPELALSNLELEQPILQETATEEGEEEGVVIDVDIDEVLRVQPA